MMNDTCSDDRFELIGKAKAKLLESTNIEMCSDEMAVLDNILFRCWQMGRLNQLHDSDTHWDEMFGTPERTTKTMMKGALTPCVYCELYSICLDIPGDDCLRCDSDTLLEWLRSDVANYHKHFDKDK